MYLENMWYSDSDCVVLSMLSYLILQLEMEPWPPEDYDKYSYVNDMSIN